MERQGFATALPGVLLFGNSYRQTGKYSPCLSTLGVNTTLHASLESRSAEVVVACAFNLRIRLG